MTPDPYAVLGVGRNAAPAEVAAAYRTLVRELHPDTHSSDPGRLAEVVTAYQTLRARHRSDDARLGAWIPEQAGARTHEETGARIHERAGARTHEQAGARTDEETGTRIRVRVRRGPPAAEPVLRAGPVRRLSR